MKFENIAAISTGLVASGVAVIRLSGDSPLNIAKKINEKEIIKGLYKLQY